MTSTELVRSSKRLRTGPPSTSGAHWAFPATILAGLALCVVAYALPADGSLIIAKLVIATYSTMLLPGAVILRLVGWPRSPAVAFPACVAWSIAALAPGLWLMFALDLPFRAAVGWLLAVTLAGLVLGRRSRVEMHIRFSWQVAVLAAGVVAFTVLLWMGSHNNVGDAIEHIGRLRKLTELSPPRGLTAINVLPPDTGLHPGYAFPLWHAVGGVIVKIAHLEETVVFRYWSPLLMPLVAAATYRAGRTMFGCREGGVATLIASLALFAFPYAGVGHFILLAYPGFVAIFLLWPLVIGRTIDYLRDGGREPVLTVAVTSFVVTAIHPSYVPFMIMLLGGFLGVRLFVDRHPRDAARLAVMVGATAVPFLLFLLWLFPVASTGGSGLALEAFSTLLVVNGDLLRMKPEWVTRGGAAHIAALLLVPLVGLASRTRAAAFISTSTAIVIFALIVPWLFTPLADVMSISQSRRMLFYLPWAFALAGGALVLARFRHFAVAGAVLAALVLQWRWPGDFAYSLVGPGPGWVAWFAAIGAVAAIAIGAFRKGPIRYGAPWAVPIMIAFTLPIAVAGLGQLKLDKARADGFSDGFVAAVNKHVSRDDVLLAEPDRAYRLSARAPIYIVAAAPGHGGDTAANQHDERRSAATTFFEPTTGTQQREAILDRWDVDWVLVRKGQPYPQEFLDTFEVVHQNRRFRLYKVSGRS